MNASRLRCIARRLVKYWRRNSIRQCSCRIVPLPPSPAEAAPRGPARTSGRGPCGRSPAAPSPSPGRSRGSSSRRIAGWCSSPGRPAVGTLLRARCRAAPAPPPPGRRRDAGPCSQPAPRGSALTAPGPRRPATSRGSASDPVGSLALRHSVPLAVYLAQKEIEAA